MWPSSAWLLRAVSAYLIVFCWGDPRVPDQLVWSYRVKMRSEKGQGRGSWQGKCRRLVECERFALVLTNLLCETTFSGLLNRRQWKGHTSPLSAFLVLWADYKMISSRHFNENLHVPCNIFNLGKIFRSYHCMKYLLVVTPSFCSWTMYGAVNQAPSSTTFVLTLLYRRAGSFFF